MNTRDDTTDDEPTRENLIETITGRPLVDMPNLVDSDRCKRCEEKNRVRTRYDIPRRDEEFDDGERVRLIVLFDEEAGWKITAANHLDHPQKDPDEVAVPDTTQAKVTARVDRDGWTYTLPAVGDSDGDTYHVDDRCVVYDVEVEWFSPEGEGEEREPIREPGEHGFIELKPTDPRPNWPEEDNEWREKLMREHGDWNDGIPTYDLGEAL